MLCSIICSVLIYSLWTIQLEYILCLKILNLYKSWARACESTYSFLLNNSMQSQQCKFFYIQNNTMRDVYSGLPCLLHCRVFWWGLASTSLCKFQINTAMPSTGIYYNKIFKLYGGNFARSLESKLFPFVHWIQVDGKHNVVQFCIHCMHTMNTELNNVMFTINLYSVNKRKKLAFKWTCKVASV